MKSFALSETGTIRDKNQDYFYSNPGLRLFILADGKGTEGLALAKTICQMMNQIIREYVGNIEPDYACQCLKDALDRSIQKLKDEQKYSGSGVEICAFWAIGNLISGISTGNAYAAIQNEGSTISAFWENDRISGPHKLRSCDSSVTFYSAGKIEIGSRLIIGSEGIVLGTNRKAFLRNIPPTGSDQDTFKRYLRTVRSNYDGDDQTLAVIEFENGDLIPPKPQEFTLYTDLDKQFSFKLWMPMALMSSFGFISSLVGFKIVRTILAKIKKFKN